MRTRATPIGSTGPHRTGLASIFALLTACGAPAEDTGPVELPPEDTSGWREDTGTFPFDTSDTGTLDETPAHWLTFRQAGTLLLGGAIADPSSVTGTLVITELLDGDEEAPACEQTWALVGERAPVDCDGCAYTFDVLHTRVEATGGCRAPELPDDGEERTLGYATGEGRIYWDWYETGVWVPLWDAGPGETPDAIAIAWETTVGVEVEEEEE